MKPIDQTTFGKGTGNCMAACVASILEIPLEDVPDIRGDDQYALLCFWLAERGVGIVDIAFKPRLKMQDTGVVVWGQGYYIGGGKSPRGDFDHAVVMCAGGIVHDPHPDKRGIEDIDSLTFLTPGHDAKWTSGLKQLIAAKNPQ